MTAKMRAKCRVTQIIRFGSGGEELRFSFPAKDGGYPADGSDEDQSFSTWTPSASLAMTIKNPALVGTFEVGDTFYLDFTPVDE